MIQRQTVPNVESAGRAIGAIFLVGFGAAWLALWAANEFTPPWLPLGLVVSLACVLLFLALRTYRSNRAALSNVAADPEQKRRSKLFNYVNAGQWGLIFATASLLAYLGRPTYIVPAIIAIVGFHFLPLAWLFRYVPHYVTGVALVAWSVLCVLTPGIGPGSALGPLGAGLVLWASACWALKAVTVPRGGA